MNKNTLAVENAVSKMVGCGVNVRLNDGAHQFSEHDAERVIAAIPARLNALRSGGTIYVNGAYLTLDINKPS